MDDSYGLLQIQKINLLLLQEIDRICRKYKIAYHLDSGTLLGAIRHGGFIPWDDDADIAMPRDSWEVFKKVAARELPDGMELILPGDLKSGKGVFYDFTARLIYKKSSRHTETEEDRYYGGKLNHIWVDIFIMDRLPNKGMMQKVYLNLHKFIYLLAMGHRYHLDYRKYTLVQKAVIGIVSFVGSLLDMKFLYHIQDKLAKLYRKKKTGMIFFSNYQPDYIDICMEETLISTDIDIRFEDTELRIPEKYDEILKRLYGDYMKLPNKADRKASHGSREIKIYE